MRELWIAFILGVVEGLTEFAPISSTGHMIIVDDLLLQSKNYFSSEVANSFKIVIQLGSILAVVIVFKNRFKQLLLPSDAPKGQKRLSFTHIIIGLIPAGVLGILFEDVIDAHLFSVKTVVIGLIAGAILMMLADWKAKRQTAIQSIDQLTIKQAFLIGLFQCLSLWPGFSRSGSTISGGVILGISHRTAADFTFIMAVPIMLGASLISLKDHWAYFQWNALPFFICGFISAFVFALISIRFFLVLIDKIKLTPFALYRMVIAGIISLTFL
ncbi:undecaprenyl-diphosphate phosphatase [Gracilibacillus alcaliphilus]|uniref:undecaprenyl-diphosphate phosphatase n=1 Tax=Gracilibacillus alcaliphilus TaxID=1401441 RepID=UPI00195EB689|nr:undecaprenyl-diphosphate phosphatase [Gracilibacillus alcaliphilus]MBM7677772.1 undecaprenyl-diphosphatase [Gracilibacillus alcaliphilus]